jgi:hypothetical protein
MCSDFHGMKKTIREQVESVAEEETEMKEEK